MIQRCFMLISSLEKSQIDFSTQYFLIFLNVSPLGLAMRMRGCTNASQPHAHVKICRRMSSMQKGPKMGQILGPKCACKKSAHGHWAALFSTHSMSFQRERFTSKPRASTQCPPRAAFFYESVLRISFWILDFCICCCFCVPLFY